MNQSLEWSVLVQSAMFALDAKHLGPKMMTPDQARASRMLQETEGA